MSENAEHVCPPRLKDSKKNLQIIAVTGSSQVDAIDAQLRQRWVRIKALSADVTFYLRSDSSGTVAILATDQASDSATSGYTIAAGSYEDFLLGGQDNYIVHIGSTTGSLQLLGSGPKRIVDGANAGP